MAREHAAAAHPSSETVVADMIVVLVNAFNFQNRDKPGWFWGAANVSVSAMAT